MIGWQTFADGCYADKFAPLAGAIGCKSLSVGCSYKTDVEVGVGWEKCDWLVGSLEPRWLYCDDACSPWEESRLWGISSYVGGIR